MMMIALLLFIELNAAFYILSFVKTIISKHVFWHKNYILKLPHQENIRDTSPGVEKDRPWSEYTFWQTMC